MEKVMKNPSDIQKEYYAKTAQDYDGMHVSGFADTEHNFALAFLSSMIDYFGIKSVLDVGAGTGRAIAFLQGKHPELIIKGIEPVKELREVGYSKGISDTILISGDGNKLDFIDASFDLVCAFGVLHHVPTPGMFIGEMTRVAKKAIFISDGNNFGQGNTVSRFIKQTINFFGLWKTYDLLRTRGKGYQISEGDGLFYSYSIFNNYKQIEKNFKTVHLLNSNGGKFNFYRTASHLALLALK
jgi:SAM-dependent methyltransferase